jgi:hypothetical protein
MKPWTKVNPEQLHLHFRESVYGIKRLIRNPYFYIGLILLLFGIQLNYYSQTYLYNHYGEGNALPGLPDLILDHIPYWDVDYLYDFFCLAAGLIFVFYIIDKKAYGKVPYFLLLLGIFQTVRGIFIVLTPLGNPPLFDGTQGLFNGFSKYEYGVYPSGHVGAVFLYCLLSESKTYKTILLVCLTIIITSLFLARGHYSIDIISGVLFAYAIKAFGDRYLLQIFSQTSLNGKSRNMAITFKKAGSK